MGLEAVFPWEALWSQRVEVLEVHRAVHCLPSFRVIARYLSLASCFVCLSILNEVCVASHRRASFEGLGVFVR